MLQSIYTYHQLNSLDLKATAYKPSGKAADHSILYFHGGGLIYGQREDLPEEYISLFLEAGYNFITFDYPLAPESSLETIYLSGKKGVQQFIEKATTELEMETSSFSLFGRSAGAYLCFLLAKDTDLPNPTHLIDFYGYESLAYEEFFTPSAHYASYPQLPQKAIERMIQPQPIVKGPLQTRYALYLYARQTGKWMEFLNISKEEAEKQFSLSQSELEQLPPTFIAHSKADQDVPFFIAEKLNDTIPQAHFYTVSDKEHDFDRDPNTPEAKEAYEQLLKWMKETI